MRTLSDTDLRHSQHSGTSDGTRLEMEKLKEDLKGKRNLLLFTLGKSERTGTGNVQTIKRHREALSSIADQIDALKLQVVKEMFKSSDSEENIGDWSNEIEKEIGEVDPHVLILMSPWLA